LIKEKNGTAIIISVVFFKLAFHLASFARYGFFRDELYYIACSDHLALGYVDQPPLSIFVLKAVRLIMGDSLFALRFLPALLGAAAVFLTALTARRLGGGKFAQGLSALAVAVAPVFLGNGGRYFSMNAFDIFFWALAGYLVILIIATNRDRLWPVFGLVVGFGLLNKYSLGFFVIWLVVGLILTSERRRLFNGWFWLGAAIALFIFLPHILWEIKLGFPSLEFMRNASRLKNMPMSPLAFFLGQMGEVGVGSAPIWLLGLYYYFFDRKGKAFRFLGWMYLAVFALMVFQKAKVYYLTPIYPLLLAAGAVFVENLARRGALRWLKPATAALILVSGLIFAPLAVPILPLKSFLRYQEITGFKPRQEERSQLGILPQHYADMFCWEEMATTVAKIYQGLSPEEKSDCLIYARNYGEAGAIDFFGKKYGLPRAVSAHNNYWLWGYGNWTGKAAIIWGTSRDLKTSLEDLQRGFEEVEPAATLDCPYAMPYENGRTIFICRRIKISFPEVWLRDKRFR
jgi:hypothetical protein